MALDKKAVLEALKPVMDPELKMSIMDLGMVKEVRVENDDVYVKIALTAEGCPLVDKIRTDVSAALRNASSVKIEFETMSKEELEVVREKIQKRSSVENKVPVSNQQPVTGITKMSKAGIRNIIAIASGKGGVGKSFATAILATEIAKRGYHVGILDADITGPSMAKVFGLTERVTGSPTGILPAQTKLGIKVISMNLVLEKPDDAVVWRGPILNQVIRQMYSDVDWGDLHFLLVDLPPGTSDSPLTVYQSMPVNGSVIITTPQDLALMIVKKAIRMATTMKIPILGLVENMSYFNCPSCNEHLSIFGRSKGEENSKEIGIPFLGVIPLDPEIPKLSDLGHIEDYSNPDIVSLVDKILENLKNPPKEQAKTVASKKKIEK
ncbi:MAG: Mrp/NBP35 family ATP-binding protein [Nitrososphaerales archaeon]|jgi:Mrp family chromosome partitioning ATPase|nr:Mrp/NBP35 family ATP-binding protein [Nitrososphaerales archaeon]HJN57734.1 Mrp/NBP35 family ATP-binding protein [Nitrososphaerales archaeon]|tara:strand:- start:2093 stop:3232 length:1140 start_codon:yes stop_codon:yes gene_type:complete